MTRLAYFPSPLEGELVYSIVARFKAHTGMTRRATTMLLFGSPIQEASYEIHPRLGALASRMPEDMGYDAGKLLRDHTLFPYYVYGQTQKGIRKSWRKAIAKKDGSNTGLKSTGLFKRRPPFLRFCPQCHEESIAKCGEAYWRREHQLPLVAVCPFHECDLLYSSLDRNIELRMIEYLEPSPATCPRDAQTPLPHLSDEQRKDLLEIARRSVEDLLDPTKHFTRAGLQECADERLRSKALSGLRPARRSALKTLAMKRFDHMRDTWPNLILEPTRKFWHERKRKDRFDPSLLYILETTCNGLPDQTCPFGPGPFPCLNKLNAHYGEPTINTCTWRFGRKGWVGTFSCRCGFTYLRTQTADREKRIRIADYGPDLDDKIRGAISANRTAVALSLELTINVKRLRKIAGSLGHGEAWPVLEEPRIKSR